MTRPDRAGPRPDMADTPRRLIAFGHADDDPATRFRLGQYIPSFERAGWSVSLRTRHPPYPWVTPWRNGLLHLAHAQAAGLIRRGRRLRDIWAASSFDAVLLNRDLLEGRFAYEARLFDRNPRVIFDFDDAIFLGDGKSRHIAQICERAAWVFAGNEYPASFARQHAKRVTVVPTVVDTDAYAIAGEAVAGRPVRVGWLGSDRSIDETLAPFVPVLADLQRDLGFEFVVVTRPKPEL